MRTFIFIFLSCLLSACGFHLRGAVLVPNEIHRIAIKSSANYSQFQQNLQQLLKSSGAQLVNDPQQADLLLVVDSEQIFKTFVSVGTNVQLHQYTLHYVVDYQLKNREQLTIMPAQHIEVLRVYRENANQELGSSNEETVLIHEMEQEALNNLLARLFAPETLRASRIR